VLIETQPLAAVASSYLAFATTTGAGDLTERLRLDSSGNLGLGVTPSAWEQQLVTRSCKLAVPTALYGRASTGYDQAGLYSNARFASGTNDWRYYSHDVLVRLVTYKLLALTLGTTPPPAQQVALSRLLRR
jgi:hypothetical protein